MAEYRIFVLSSLGKKIEGAHPLSATPIRKQSPVPPNMLKAAIELKSGRMRE